MNSQRNHQRRAGSSTGRSRRRWRPLWTLLGLFGLGLVATLLSSRRIEPLEEEDWQDLLEEEEPPPDRREPFPSTHLEVEGPAGKLHVEDGGSGGLPVVFVHGLAGSTAQWRDQLGHLRGERRALAVDLRGHGRSEAAEDGEYGISALADDLAAVVDELGLPRYVLAAHSLGALVAMELATREPQRVAGLFLVDPNGDQTEIPRKELNEFLASIRSAPRDEMRWYFKQVLVGSETTTADEVLASVDETAEGALVAALESSFEYSPVAALESYPGPVLSVISDMNTLPYSLHNLLEDLPVRQVHGTSHWLMLDKPDELNRHLDQFLAKVESGAA